MKKYLYSIVLFLALFISSDVYADASFNMSLVGDSTFEKEITINLQVGSLTEFNGFCKGLCGFEGTLNYDNEKIELVSIEGLAGFDLTDGPKKVLYKTTGVGTGTNIMKMVFKNKSLKKDESATISLTNTSASDGDKDVTGKDISKTIKLIVKETEKEEPKPSTNTNNNSTNTTTNKKEEEKKSDNNYLSSVTLSQGTIDFDKNTLSYDIIVPYETETIKIEAKTEDEKATIEGVGEHKLEIGSNKIELTVKAEDESERKYVITVNREKENIVVEEDDKTETTIECPEEDNSNNLFAVIISIIAVIELGVIVALLMKNKQR